MSKVKRYIHSDLRGDVFVSEKDSGRKYKLFATTPVTEYYVSKSASMRGWNRWVPRLNNLVVNDHISAGGKATDVRCALPSVNRKPKKSQNQMRLF